MRTFLKNIVVTVVLVLSLFSFETKGQIGSVYPVDLNVMLTPPYGTCLTDLSNSNRFVIQALLRDMNHGNNYEMLIQMRVKSLSSMNTVFLSYSNKFSIGMGKPAVVLGAGNTPVSISNFFESGNVLIGQNILNDNCLPEGAYLFCFQAFDAKAYYAKQRIPISKEFTVTAFLENGATPILISPANNDSLSCQLPNVIFQWQQPYITSGINSYTLQVAEANSPFDGPQIIENGGNLLIEKRGLMMPICDIPVTEANFKENHTYYWRVVMCDKDGKARASYPNKGASPVYKFVYCGTPQEPEPEDAWVPQIPMAKSIKKSLDRLRIDTVLSDESSCSAYWFQDPVDVREKYDGVVIEVKKKNQDTWTPFLMESKVATDTLVALSSLAYKETYMARGQYFLYEDGEKVYAPYSDTIEFKIPHPADTLECGNAAPELTDCTNAGERAELEIGDEFNANGTTVSIDTITYQSVNGSSVIISGEGHLPFPILSKFGLKVSFDNIEINCADELKKGQVISVYDEKTAAMIDLNNILGKGAAGNDLKQEDASLNEVGPDDDLSGFKSGDLIVEDGKVSLIVGNGNVVQVGTVIDLSNSDAYNDNGALNDEDIYVKFSNPDHENIAFDDDPTGMIRRAATLSRNYVSFGEEYIIPWVATNPGRIFQLTAMPSKDLSKSGFTDVKFVLPASGTHVVLDAVENGDGSYSVSIPGMKVDVQNQVYAIARKGEGSPYENVGKLNLCCYSYKSKKVVIVPLLEGLSVNTDEVKKDLDRVYAKLGYTFEVELDDDAAHREGLSTTIGLETDFLSDFSEEMKELIFNYEINIGDAYDKDAAYLFLLDKPTGKYKDAAGIMPQRQQYGFIFMQGAVSITTDLTHTMAHELGHGIFGLDHIFSGAYGIKKGATYNLMDYTDKTPNDALSYHEWTQINRPLPSWSALSRAEEDMILKMKSTTIIEALKQSNEYGENKRIVLQLGGWDPEYLSGPIGFNTDGFAYCKPLVDKRSGLFNYRVSCSSYSNFGISELSSELFVISSNYKERNFVNNDVIYKFEILEKKDKIFPIIPNECVTITLPSEMYRYFEAYVYGTELSVSEISEIRNDIAAMPSTTEAEKAAKEQAYLDLQWVVPYQNQRSLETMNTQTIKMIEKKDSKGNVVKDENGDVIFVLEHKRHYTMKKTATRTYTTESGEKFSVFESNTLSSGYATVGDVMCNLTSLAMGMEYLGVENKCADKQYADCINQTAYDNGIFKSNTDFDDQQPKRKSVEYRKQMAEHWGVEQTSINKPKETTESYESFKARILPYLKEGDAIYFSMGQHVVRLVALYDDYMVVDDPYGCLCSDESLQKRSKNGTGVYCNNSRKMDCCSHNKAYDANCSTNSRSQSANKGRHCKWRKSGVNKIRIYNICKLTLKQ